MLTGGDGPLVVVRARTRRPHGALRLNRGHDSGAADEIGIEHRLQSEREVEAGARGLGIQCGDELAEARERRKLRRTLGFGA